MSSVFSLKDGVLGFDLANGRIVWNTIEGDLDSFAIPVPPNAIEIQIQNEELQISEVMRPSAEMFCYSVEIDRDEISFQRIEGNGYVISTLDLRHIGPSINARFNMCECPVYMSIRGFLLEISTYHNDWCLEIITIEDG